MQIFHTITTIERGGAENQLLILAREQISIGDSVTIIPLKENLDLLDEFQGIGCAVEITAHNRNIFQTIRHIRLCLKRYPNAVVHAHLPRAEIITRLALIALPHPFIVSRHNAEQFWPSIPIPISSLISLWVTRRAKFTVAISKVVRDFIATKREVSKKSEIEVVHYGYSSFFTNQDLIRPPKIGSENIKLITIGRLSEQKNYPFILETLKLLKINGIEVSLTVLGTGPLLENLKGLAKELDIADKCLWFGKTPNVISQLLEHDGLLMASNYEGFCLVLLEAMQTSTPIIAPNHSTFPEILGNDYPGLFEPGNCEEAAEKISRLRNPDFCFETSSHLLKRIELFKPQEMMLSLRSIYMKAYSSGKI